MAVAPTFHSTVHYLVATFVGTASLGDFFAAIDAVGLQARASGASRVLVDLRAVHEQFKFTDHFSVGERVATRLRHLERIASLVPPSRRTGTSEQVANQQGLLLRVFVSEPDAVAWLTAP